jgi:hypothetical protein
MMRSVAREYKWPPDLIGGFFIDNIDHYGLEFWYEDIIKMIEETNNKK